MEVKAEEEKSTSSYPGERGGRRKKLPKISVGEPVLDSALLEPVVRCRRKKTVLPNLQETTLKNVLRNAKTMKKCHSKKKTPHLPKDIAAEFLKLPKEKITYHCSECGKDFPHSYRLERHILTHTGQKPYRCSVCGRGFNQKGNLKTHQKVHTGGKCIIDKDSLLTSELPEVVPLLSELPGYHEPLQDQEPSVELSLRCLTCGRDCENLAALQAHHVTSHTQQTTDSFQTAPDTDLQLHFCHRCGIQFSDLKQLVEHQQSHFKDKPYSCPDCGKRFINESYVEVHQRIHTGEKPFLCSQCGKGYYTASALKLHEMRHSGERPFSCSLCGKKFHINSYLMAHYQTHVKERPFLCTICGKSYTRAEELKAHHRLHTGERPYQCGDCGKSFIYRQGLRQHQRTHTGRPIGPTRQLGRPKQQPSTEKR